MSTELYFEWDEEKEVANIKKHGIDFKSASFVFLDMNRIEIFDEAHSELEDRYITIGVVEEVLTVVYTERKKSIRIISARKANALERSYYYDNINN